MAKQSITPSTVATNNIQNQTDQVKNNASALKLAFDQYGIDDKTYTNDTLIAELNGDDGSKKIGHNSTSVTADNVGDALEENRLAINGIVLGQIPDNSLTNVKLAPDIKIGSLAQLKTEDKTSVVAAINEVNVRNIVSDPVVDVGVSAGDVVLINAGTWETSQNGIAIYDGTNIVLSGIINLTGLKADRNYYAQADGSIDVVPTAFYVGLAISTTELIVDIDTRDTTPPDPVTSLAVDTEYSETGDEVVLSWTNPADADFAGVRIVWKTGSYPTDIDDGTVISSATSPQTITGLTQDVLHYFNVYTYDAFDNYSVAEQITATPILGEERLYGCDNAIDQQYELNPDTLATLNVLSVANPYGIGGISARLFACLAVSDYYELNPDTLAIINTLDIAFIPRGIGGIDFRLFSCDDTNDNLYELNPDTFATINTVGSPSTDPLGIGGIISALYHCDNNLNNIYELNPDTLAVINTVSSPGTTPQGIGGINLRLYICDGGADNNYELNPSTLAVINTVSASGTNPQGIGGIKVA